MHNNTKTHVTKGENLYTRIDLHYTAGHFNLSAIDFNVIEKSKSVQVLLFYIHIYYRALIFFF